MAGRQRATVADHRARASRERASSVSVDRHPENPGGVSSRDRPAHASRVFISHAKCDREFVTTELLGLLKALGLDPWFDENEIEVSADFESRLQVGLEQSEWFAVVVSAGARASNWVKFEVNWAVQSRPTQVIPIAIDNTKPIALHLGLGPLHHVNFTRDPRRAREQLIDLLVTRQYRAPTVTDLLQNPTGPRRRAIEGDWHGELVQPGPQGKAITIDAACTISWRGRVLHGTFNFECAALRIKEALPFTGGFFYDQFLKLDYYDTNTGAVQFGVLMMELDAAGRRLKGIDVGFGYTMRRILTGRLTMTKEGA